MKPTAFLTWWPRVAPPVAIAVLGLAWPAAVGVLTPVAVIALVAAVFAAVHHAEDVAHIVGEPFGTLVLAVAVTVIEVGLIVSIMVGGGADKAALPRDTVFAAVMLVCNGIVGLCLLLGSARHYEQDFLVQGANAALAVLAALTTLTLVLPNYTVTSPGPVFTPSQLTFAGLVSLVLYGSFVFVQTVRHRDYFVAADATRRDEVDGSDRDAGHRHVGANLAMASILLVIALTAVVGLAKALTPFIEASVDRLGAPKSFVGIVIAVLVLLPESFAALNAARANRLQTSLNLALGSALASIGLTIPAVALVSLLIDLPLTLGLGPMQLAFLALTLLVTAITLGTGRTTVLQGIVHLVILATYLFLSVVP